MKTQSGGGGGDIDLPVLLFQGLCMEQTEDMSMEGKQGFATESMLVFQTGIAGFFCVSHVILEHTQGSARTLKACGPRLRNKI